MRLPFQILSFSFVVACGGGGAAVEPLPSSPASPQPASPAAPSNTPIASGATIVSTVGTTFSPGTITIAPGATVVWQVAGATHNVTFGTAKPDGGDVPDTRSGSTASRVFATPGTYDYQCTRHSGMSGRIVVSGDVAQGPSTTPAPAPASGVVVQSGATAFTPKRVEVAAGTSVSWEFAQGAGGVIFDDVASAGGNIPAQSPGSRVTRTFTAAGDYDYHSSIDRDVKGRIRVR